MRMHAGYRFGGTRLADVSELQACQVGERCTVTPLAPLEEFDDSAVATSGTQADIVYAGSHDRHSASRLGKPADIGGPASTAEQSGRPDRRPAQRVPTLAGPDPARVKSTALIEYLQHHPVPGDLGDHLVAPGPSVLQHVGAGFSRGQEQIRDAGLAQAEPAEGIAKYAAHDGDAQRLVRKHEAEPDRPTVPGVSGQFVLVQQPRSHVPMCLPCSAVLRVWVLCA